MKRPSFLLLTIFILFASAAAVFRPELALFIFLAAFVGAVFWRKAHMLVALAIAAIPLGNILGIPLSENVSLDASVTEALLGIAFLLAVAERLSKEGVRPRSAFRRDTVFWLLLGFVVLASASFPKVIDGKLFFFEWRVVTFWLVAYVTVTLSVDTYRKARLVLGGAAVAVFLFAIQAFWLFLQHGYSLGIFYDRNLLMLPVGAIAYASALLGFLLPVLFGFFIAERNRPGRILILAVGAVGTLALLMMLSKGAIAGFALGMGFFVFKNRMAPLKPVLLMFGAVLVFLAIFSPFLAGLVERSIHAFVDVNSQYRILEYSLSWSILREHWLSGVGLGQQPIYFQKIYYPDFVNFVNNYALQMWIDLGVAGLAVAAGLLVELFRRAARSIRDLSEKLSSRSVAIGIVSGMIAAAFNGLVEVTFFGLAYAVVFWVFVGVLRNVSIWPESR